MHDHTTTYLFQPHKLWHQSLAKETAFVAWPGRCTDSQTARLCKVFRPSGLISRIFIKINKSHTLAHQITEQLKKMLLLSKVLDDVVNQVPLFLQLVVRHRLHHFVVIFGQIKVTILPFRQQGGHILNYNESESYQIKNK